MSKFSLQSWEPPIELHTLGFLWKWLLIRHEEKPSCLKDDSQCLNVKCRWHDSARAECPCFSGDWYLPSARIVWTTPGKKSQLISFTVLMGIQLTETQVFAFLAQSSGCSGPWLQSSGALLVALIEGLMRAPSHETQHFQGTV